MTQSINWSTTPDKEKTQLIIEYIMGWTCFQLWEDIAGDHHWRIVSERMDITDPVAFWHEESQQWSITYHDQAKSAEVFDPLHNMNDAWTVLKYVVIAMHLETPKLDTLVHKLFGTRSIEPHDLNPHYTLGFLCAWTPEFICIAALLAIGMQIEG